MGARPGHAAPTHFQNGGGAATVVEASRCAINQSGLSLSWWPRGFRYQALALNFVPDNWSSIQRLGPEEP